MAANSLNRKGMRKALGALLSTALVGSGKPAQAVYDHLTYDFLNQSPVVVIAPVSTRRKIGVVGVTQRDTTVNLNIYVFVAYASVDSNTYTEAESTDLLDDIEKAIADVLIDSTTRTTPVDGVAWDKAEQREDTSIEEFVIGGMAYWRELIPVTLIRKLG